MEKPSRGRPSSSGSASGSSSRSRSFSGSDSRSSSPSKCPSRSCSRSVTCSSSPSHSVSSHSRSPLRHRRSSPEVVKRGRSPPPLPPPPPPKRASPPPSRPMEEDANEVDLYSGQENRCMRAECVGFRRATQRLILAFDRAIEQLNKLDEEDSSEEG